MSRKLVLWVLVLTPNIIIVFFNIIIHRTTVIRVLHFYSAIELILLSSSQLYKLHQRFYDHTTVHVFTLLTLHYSLRVYFTPQHYYISIFIILFFNNLQLKIKIDNILYMSFLDKRKSIFLVVKQFVRHTIKIVLFCEFNKFLRLRYIYFTPYARNVALITQYTDYNWKPLDR